jgi:ribonuclease BN (tRNA processing enzyme)
VKLTVVGCAGSIPSAESPSSCYLVEHDGFRLVVDLGHGALGALQKYIGIGDIDAIAISHLHADHWIDLTALYVALRYSPNGHRRHVPIYGPEATADRLADAYGLKRSPGGHSYFDFTELATVSAIGPFRVRTVATAHPTPTTAIKLEVGGGSIVYTADTGPCAQLVDFADGADVLLAEASFVDGEDNPSGLHLTGKQAGELASAAGVSHLVVTHVPPWNSTQVAVAEARTTFGGELTLARPGWSVDLGR